MHENRGQTSGSKMSEKKKKRGKNNSSLPYYGKKPVLRVSKIFGGKEGQETVGLRFESEEAERLGNWLMTASQEKKIIDITVFKKTHQVTVTAPKRKKKEEPKN